MARRVSFRSAMSPMSGAASTACVRPGQSARTALMPSRCGPCGCSTMPSTTRRTTPRSCGGAYTTAPIAPSVGLSADLYYFGFERDRGSFAQGTAHEQRHTVGGRLFGALSGWDWDVEAAGQVGSFGDADIRAWWMAGNAGSHSTAHRGGRGWASGRISAAAMAISAMASFRPSTPSIPPSPPSPRPTSFIPPTSSACSPPSPSDQRRRSRCSSAGTCSGGSAARTPSISPAHRLPAPPAATASSASPCSSPRCGRQRRIELKAWYVHYFAGSTIEQGGGKDLDYLGLVAAFKF